MPSFIVRAACRGRRPSQFAPYAGHQRPALIARMLKERGVARFVVAPAGYGKTSIAIEYAETIFSWAHTFWISGTSPCFIRDLDAKEIASQCLACDAEAALVVIDDLPQLDDERAQLLSREIDQLLARRCEVVVTCVPANDSSGQFQRDRMRIAASDLLLDDSELDRHRPADERMRTPASAVPASQRVPVLVWGEGGRAARQFAQEALSEELPSDLLLGMCTVLILQQGSFDDLMAIGVVDRQTLSEVASDYPHLGFEPGADRFTSAHLDVADIAAAARRMFDVFLDNSVFDSCEQLVCAWANLLLANGLAGRACDLVREICPRGHRKVWLFDHIHDLVSRACFLPALRLARDLAETRGLEKHRLLAIQALCYRMLGADAETLRIARRCGFNAAGDPSSRVCCLLILMSRGGEALAEEAAGELDGIIAATRMVTACAEGDSKPPSDGAPATEPLDGFWLQLAQAWSASMHGAEALSKLWAQMKAQGASREILCICASRLFSLIATEVELGCDPGSFTACKRPAERYVREVFSSAEPDQIDYFCASAGMALEQALSKGASDEEGPIGTAAMIVLRRFELNIVMQRRQLEAELKEELARRGDWESTHPEAYTALSRPAASTKRTDSVPTLSLKMFGKFEVSIGDELVDPKVMRRQHVRALLVVLAVNQGKEISRESMAKVMWPRSTDAMARKNFYSVWAQLRHILTLPDGTCPYLVRHQFGCSLEQRYVRSDAARLSEICRELLFGAPNLEQWSLLFAEIDRDFSSDLMPGEDRNLLVVQARNEYRSRLIDALVAATFSVIDVGNPKWGIWFARSALSHDETREDAYVALMRAQIASNQRTAAMMTFLRCRRILSDQLGIDPSPETTALYESLLDT